MGTIPMDPATLSQYLQYPIQAPPPGVTPNFVNPDSTSYQVYATAAVCTPLMLVFASFRWGCKVFVKQKVVLLDESQCCLSPVCFCICRVCSSVFFNLAGV